MNIPETLIPRLATLQKFAKKRGVELYLVGGSVRDLLLNRPTADLDFALAADAIQFAKAFAAHIGGTFVGLDEQPPTARVVLKRQNISMDFAQFRAKSLSEDLGLRDLTINAIAAPLEAILRDARSQTTANTVKNVARGPVPREPANANQNVARGPVPREPSVLIDPCGGIADLTARQLRFPSEQVIYDDALRLIRIYRFAAQLNFEISHDSLACIQKHHTLLPRVSPERIRDELMKILKVEKAGPYLQEMWKVGLLTQIIPIASESQLGPTPAARGPVPRQPTPTPVGRGPVPRQPAPTFVGRGPVPRQRGSGVVARGTGGEPVGRGPVPRQPWNALDTFESTTHAHPDCDAYLKTELGWEVNRRSLIKLCLLLQGELGDAAKRLKLSRKATQFLKCIAAEHCLLATEQLSHREIIRFLRRTASDWLGALLFAAALHGISDARITQIVDTYYQHFLPIQKQGRLITGKDLIQQFNLKTGREIGRLLKEIEERQFDGEIRTREEAFVVVERLIR